MFRSFRRHLTYANVMSTFAVFVVLGGGAYAASNLGKDSVKSKQIKAGAVKNADLADNAVTSSKVADGSLLGEDFAAGQIPSGAVGPAGPKGETGSIGLQGPAGTASAYARVFPGASPSLVSAQTSNFTAVSSPGVGVYCLTPAAGVTAANRPVALTVDWGMTDNPEGNAAVMSADSVGTGVCTASQFTVVTERHTPTADALPTYGIGFSIIVP